MPSLTNPLINQYRRYRSASKKLNLKITGAFMSAVVLDTAANALGLDKKKRLPLDGEDGFSELMDYAFYEVQLDGQNLIERYVIEKGGGNRAERDLLEAMLNAKTGLFRVEQVLASRYLLNLQEIATGDRALSMIDISFSQFPAENCVFFFRPIELADFTMSSGMSFVFPPEMESELIERWQQWDRSERYAKCFKLYKSKGIPVKYR